MASLCTESGEPAITPGNGSPSNTSNSVGSKSRSNAPPTANRSGNVSATNPFSQYGSESPTQMYRNVPVPSSPGRSGRSSSSSPNTQPDDAATAVAIETRLIQSKAVMRADRVARLAHRFRLTDNFALNRER